MTEPAESQLLASWLMMTTLLIYRCCYNNHAIYCRRTQIQHLHLIRSPIHLSVFYAGVIGSMCYNKFKDTKLPDWLSFFSGKRCVAIVAGVVSIVVSVVLLFVWPVVFTALDHSWTVHCQDGSCWSWYLCILKPSADSNWITSRIKQCILV